MQIAIAVYDRFTALDAIGPYAVLGNLPGAEVTFVAAERGPVADDTALKVLAETSFAEVSAPDVIVVPGGLITRRMARDGDPVIDWIRAVHPTTTWTTSVCTGRSCWPRPVCSTASMPRRTGWPTTSSRPLGACPTSERVVVRGKVVTGAGVSAGIDMALTLADRIAGTFTAQAIQLGIEYDPQPPFDAGSPASAPPEIYEVLSDAMRRAEEKLLA